MHLRWCSDVAGAGRRTIDGGGTSTPTRACDIAFAPGRTNWDRQGTVRTAYTRSNRFRSRWGRRARRYHYHPLSLVPYPSMMIRCPDVVFLNPAAALLSRDGSCSWRPSLRPTSHPREIAASPHQRRRTPTLRCHRSLQFRPEVCLLSRICGRASRARVARRARGTGRFRRARSCESRMLFVS